MANVHIDAIEGTSWLDVGQNSIISYKLNNDNGFGAWTATEAAAFAAAAQKWADVADITFVDFTGLAFDSDWIENKVDTATMISITGKDFGGVHQYPKASQGALGRYNIDRSYWDAAGLAEGGRGFQLLMHEMGHGLGLAHTHDTDMGTTTFPGVSSSGDLGTDNLNETRYSIMSYNQQQPNANDNGGRSSTPMAFDIAAIQSLYGANTTINSGNDSYVMTDDGSWACIWDTGGTDEIRYNGANDALIDLRSATLDGTSTAGGYFSMLTSGSGVTGGFTIAGDYTNVLANSGGETGVIIENAYGGSGDDEIIGNNVANEIHGNNGADDIEGRGGNDTIYGGSGNDILRGGSGNDFLQGGGDNDVIYGGNGDDDVWGSSGDDWLSGGFGTDDIWGGSGIDEADYTYSNSDWVIDLDANGNEQGTASADGITETIRDVEDLTMGVGNDMLYGTSLANRIRGGDGNDEIDGRGGDDVLNGEGDNDIIDGGLGNDYISGGEGDDLMIGGRGNDRIFGYTGVDTVDYSGSALGVQVDLTLYGVSQFISLWDGFDELWDIDNINGSAQNDFLRGNDQSNLIYGLGGNDIIEGGGGNEVLNGGLNSDTASYEHATSGVVVDLDLSGGPQNTQGAGIDTLISFENLRGSAHGDILYGDFLGNTIEGLGGNDLLFGRDGNDDINGGGGDDLISGGPGNDTLDGGASDGDTVSYIFATAGVVVDLSNAAAQNTVGAGIDQLSNFENLSGSIFGDTLTGSNTVNEITGGSGVDVLNGLGGNDTLEGGADADTIDGGGGNDTASYLTSSAGVNVQLQYNIIGGGDAQGDTLISIEHLRGSEHNDTLSGNTGNNIIRGGAGSDHIRGLNGADNLYGDLGDDWLYVDSLDTATLGGGGIDRLIVVNGNGVTNTVGVNSIEVATGNSGDDRFYGGPATADLTLIGRGGDDILHGGSGDDNIFGDAGADQLRGGAGVDRLYVDENDTIIDGGAGTEDRVIVQQLLSAPTGVTIDMDASNVEIAFGGANDDTFDGSSSTVALSLYGRQGQDILIGGSANDRLFGDNNNAAAGDVLNGGEGNDFLRGGENGGGGFAERDQFVFDDDWGNDRIFDFADNGAEKIDFSSIAGITQRSDLSFSDVTDGSGSYALISYTDGGGWSASIRVYDVTETQLQNNDFIYV